MKSNRFYKYLNRVLKKEASTILVENSLHLTSLNVHVHIGRYSL